MTGKKLYLGKDCFYSTTLTGDEHLHVLLKETLELDLETVPMKMIHSPKDLVLQRT
jgi:hypothetical protein